MNTAFHSARAKKFLRSSVTTVRQNRYFTRVYTNIPTIWFYTTYILAFLPFILIPLVVNHRWIIGHRHYAAEYDLALRNLSTIIESCYHTFREERMWPRTQHDDHWYFFQRCEGARDGASKREEVGLMDIVKEGVVGSIHVAGDKISDLSPMAGQAWDSVFEFLTEWPTLSHVRDEVKDFVVIDVGGKLREVWESHLYFLTHWPRVYAVWTAIVNFLGAIISALLNIPSNIVSGFAYILAATYDLSSTHPVFFYIGSFLFAAAILALSNFAIIYLQRQGYIRNLQPREERRLQKYVAIFIFAPVLSGFAIAMFGWIFNNLTGTGYPVKDTEPVTSASSYIEPTLSKESTTKSRRIPTTKSKVTPKIVESFKSKVSSITSTSAEPTITTSDAISTTTSRSTTNLLESIESRFSSSISSLEDTSEVEPTSASTTASRATPGFFESLISRVLPSVSSLVETSEVESPSSATITSKTTPKSIPTTDLLGSIESRFSSSISSVASQVTDTASSSVDQVLSESGYAVPFFGGISSWLQHALDLTSKGVSTTASVPTSSITASSITTSSITTSPAPEVTVAISSVIDQGIPEVGSDLTFIDNVNMMCQKGLDKISGVFSSGADLVAGISSGIANTSTGRYHAFKTTVSDIEIYAQTIGDYISSGKPDILFRSFRTGTALVLLFVVLFCLGILYLTFFAPRLFDLPMTYPHNRRVLNMNYVRATVAVIIALATGLIPRVLQTDAPWNADIATKANMQFSKSFLGIWNTPVVTPLIWTKDAGLALWHGICILSGALYYTFIYYGERAINVLVAAVEVVFEFVQSTGSAVFDFLYDTTFGVSNVILVSLVLFFLFEVCYISYKSRQQIRDQWNTFRFATALNDLKNAAVLKVGAWINQLSQFITKKRLDLGQFTTDVKDWINQILVQVLNSILDFFNWLFTTGIEAVEGTAAAAVVEEDNAGAENAGEVEVDEVEAGREIAEEEDIFQNAVERQEPYRGPGAQLVWIIKTTVIFYYQWIMNLFERLRNNFIPSLPMPVRLALNDLSIKFDRLRASWAELSPDQKSPWVMAPIALIGVIVLIFHTPTVREEAQVYKSGARNFTTTGELIKEAKINLYDFYTNFCITGYNAWCGLTTTNWWDRFVAFLKSELINFKITVIDVVMGGIVSAIKTLSNKYRPQNTWRSYGLAVGLVVAGWVYCRWALI